MAKAKTAKKKKAGKRVYTYHEYVENLRPRSLGEIENTPIGFRPKPTLELRQISQSHKEARS